MRIEIDFDNKTIEVKDQVTIGFLVEKLKEMGLKDWKEYKLKQGDISLGYLWPFYPQITYINIPQPLPQPLPQPYVQPWQPYDPPYRVTCDSTAYSNIN
jgi:hypothetical protein